MPRVTRYVVLALPCGCRVLGSRTTQTAPCTLASASVRGSGASGGGGALLSSELLGDLSILCTLFRRSASTFGGKGGHEGASWEPKVATFTVVEISVRDGVRRERKLGLATLDLSRLVPAEAEHEPLREEPSSASSDAQREQEPRDSGARAVEGVAVEEPRGETVELELMGGMLALRPPARRKRPTLQGAG